MKELTNNSGFDIFGLVFWLLAVIFFSLSIVTERLNFGLIATSFGISGSLFVIADVMINHYVRSINSETLEE